MTYSGRNFQQVDVRSLEEYVVNIILAEEGNLKFSELGSVNLT